jgi:4-amino-4-deoxy-L-arabinose transferase-like glycosyltransferase
MVFFHHRGWHYLLLLLLSGIVFFLNLGGATLWDLDEGRNATAALEMLRSGDWIKPTFNAELRDHKPALLYWLQALAYLCFGVNEFAARFPSAMAVLFTVLLTYELARSMFGRTTGLLAGLVVATTPMLCGAGRFANPDALLNAFTVLTMTIFWLGVGQRRWWWFLSLGAASGFAMLAKGPVGFVLPGAVITLFILWERQWRFALNWRWTLTAISFTLIGVPWFILVGMETHGEFLRGFFLRHNLERGMSTMENHGGFPGYYLVVLCVGTAPWSIFLGLAWWAGFWSAIRQPWNRCQSLWARTAEMERQPAVLTDAPAAYRLLACWIFVYLVFFNLAATKLPNYVLPVVVPTVILIARLLQRWRTQLATLPGWFTVSSVTMLLLIGVLFAVGLTVVGGGWELSVMRGRYIHGLEQWAVIGLIPMLAALLGWRFLAARQFGRFIAVVAITALLLVGPLGAYAAAILNRCKAPQPLVEQVQVWDDTQDLRIGCWNLEHLPSLNFYLQRNVEHLKGEADIAGFLQYRLPVFLFLPLEDWQRVEKSLSGLGHVVGRHHDMYHHTEVVVVTNGLGVCLAPRER